jgi:hypothetical protein
VFERNEVHICSFDNGHVSSVDCWCEPVAIYWYENKHGVRVLVVEHDDDDSGRDHEDVIEGREHAPDWITLALEALDPS